MSKIRNRLSIKQKQKILLYYQQNTNLKLKDLAKYCKENFRFNISLSTISKLLNNSTNLLNFNYSDRKNLKNNPLIKLESELLDFIDNFNNKGGIVTESIITNEAKSLATELGIHNYKFSNGWLQNFKKRTKLKNKINHGENGNMQISDFTEQITFLKTRINKYSPHNIYNIDESALFWKSRPTRTISSNNLKGFKNNKQRITFAVCVNSTGTHKFKPIIINYSAKPRSLRNNKILEEVYYYNNRSAWMTRSIFEDVLTIFDTQVNNKILIICDNFSGHKNINLNNLINIELLFLPKNSTGILQPLDLGIINLIKLSYKKKLTNKYLFDFKTDNMEKEIDLNWGLINLVNSWKSIDSNHIINCFKKSKLIDKLDTISIEEKEINLTDIYREDIKDNLSKLNCFEISEIENYITENNNFSYNEKNFNFDLSDDETNLNKNRINLNFNNMKEKLKELINNFEDLTIELRNYNLISKIDEQKIADIIDNLKTNANNKLIKFEVQKSIKDWLVIK